MDVVASRWLDLAQAGVALLLALVVTWADAGEIDDQVRALALAGAHRAGTRVEVEVGELDARLRLAPCQRVEPYLPIGTRLWGRTRIALRCTAGVSHWNVFLPVTVKVFAQGLLAAAPLPAGTVVAEGDLRTADRKSTRLNSSHPV